MKNADKPINPIFTDSGYPVSEDRIYKSTITGLTKREYFAGLALQGTCSNQEFLKNLNADPNLVIKACIEIADELLKQLENEN